MQTYCYGSVVQGYALQHRHNNGFPVLLFYPILS
jgi:hypothetical protein